MYWDMYIIHIHIDIYICLCVCMYILNDCVRHGLFGVTDFKILEKTGPRRHVLALHAKDSHEFSRDATGEHHLLHDLDA